MKRDKKLIELFLSGYNDLFSTDYQVYEWPDEVERQKQAIDAAARDSRSHTLAVEHTLTEPFLGDKDDTRIFERVFQPLDERGQLGFLGGDIELWPAVGCIPLGTPLAKVSVLLREWTSSEVPKLPFGESRATIPGLPFEMRMLVIKSPSDTNRLIIGRSGMPETFTAVIERALRRKLPKLAAYQADKRVLLCEKDIPVRGYTEVTRVVEALAPKFPELLRIDEIWVGNSVSWHDSGDVFLYRVWPGGVTAKTHLRENRATGYPHAAEFTGGWVSD